MTRIHICPHGSRSAGKRDVSLQAKTISVADIQAMHKIHKGHGSSKHCDPLSKLTIYYLFLNLRMRYELTMFHEIEALWNLASKEMASVESNI